MADLPWIDVGTTTVARGALKVCIPTFLDHLADRADYRLRWICHLDQYGPGGQEDQWATEIDDILTVSHQFDDLVLIANRTHVGYGGGLFRIVREVRNEFLCIHDDQFFHANIRATDALQGGHDHYTWHNAGLGSTVPSYWSARLLAYLLDNYPARHRRIVEMTICDLLRDTDFTSNYDRSLGPERGDKHQGEVREIWPSSNYSQRRSVVGYHPHRRYVDDHGEARLKPRGISYVDFANEPEEP